MTWSEFGSWLVIIGLVLLGVGGIMMWFRAAERLDAEEHDYYRAVREARRLPPVQEPRFAAEDVRTVRPVYDAVARDDFG